jgi:hypothetical protein
VFAGNICLPKTLSLLKLSFFLWKDSFSCLVVPSTAKQQIFVHTSYKPKINASEIIVSDIPRMLAYCTMFYRNVHIIVYFLLLI